MIAGWTINVPELPIYAWIAMGASGLLALMYLGSLKKASKVVLIVVGKSAWGVIRVPKPIVSAAMLVTVYHCTLLWITGGINPYSCSNHRGIGSWMCSIVILGSVGCVIAVIVAIVGTVVGNENIRESRGE